MSVRDWLSRYFSRERATALGFGIASALGGAAVTAFTFGITYTAVWFVSWSFFSASSIVSLAVTVALMVALFVGNLTTSRHYLESYSFTTGTASDKVVSFDVPMIGGVSNINPLAPDSAHSLLKMVTSLLYTGPRMITGGIRHARRWKRLSGVDVDGWPVLIELLLQEGRKVPLTEIAAALPDRPLDTLLPQLAEIGGVLFLKSGVPGVSLSTDLRKDIVEGQ